jgi:hypothetical protein
MRLLAKRDIDLKRAAERKSEIDEGIKLSRRVDSLREIQANEEASLHKFRTDTIAQINTEIVAQTKLRDSLCDEVKHLERRRQEALKPLAAEIAILEHLHEQVANEKQDLDGYKDSLASYEEMLTQMGLRAATEDMRIRAMKDDAQTLLTQSNDAYDEAREALQEAQKVHDSVETLKNNTVQELRAREADIQSKERDLQIQKEWIDKDRQAIEIEKRQLADQRATLERAFKRLKK